MEHDALLEAEDARAGEPSRAPRRAVELVALYVGLPAAWAGLRAVGGAYWVVVPLVALGALVLFLLLCDRSFDRRSLLRWAPRGELPRVLVPFALGVAALTALVLASEPERLFLLPREAPGLWLAVLLLYPPFSALPQELLFRVWLVHRYAVVLRSPATRILCSATVFAFAHLIYGNVLAILLTLAGGLIFAYTYERTRSLPLVAFEHSLYGLAIFTLGLERHFLHGMWLGRLP